MSASQQKKNRQQQREEGVEKHQVSHQKAAAKAKKSRTTYTVVGSIAALLIVVAILFTSNLFYKNFAAVTVGDESYTAAEMNFFYKSDYFSFVQQNEAYLSYLGLDTTKPLSSQQFSEDMTWAEHFRESAVASVSQISAYYSEAQKADFKLDEETQAALDAELEAAKSVYVGTDYKSADAYFATVYGKGLDLATVSDLLTKRYIAAGYEKSVRDAFTYTDAQLKASATENKDDFDTYNYLSYYASGTANEEKGIDTEAAMKTAKELTDSIIKDAKTAEDFKAKTLALANTEASESYTLGSGLSEVTAEWLKDSSRREGDVAVLDADSGYYAIYYVSRDAGDYKTASVRHLLVRAEAGEDGVYTDAIKDAAKLEAETLLKEWKDGEKTEDSFTELAAKNSDDKNQAGGVNVFYENFPKNQRVEAFENWAYDEARAPGDTGIVFNDSSADDSYVGYHIMYYVGEGEVYKESLAKNKLLTDDVTKWNEETLAKYEAKTGFTMMLVK